MEALHYLETVMKDGADKAAELSSIAAEKAYHGVNSFQGIYYDLACLKVKEAQGQPCGVRPLILDKALDRIDTRLDCADFIIPGLLFLLKEYRGTEYLQEKDAARIEKSLIGFKYWLDEPGEIHACFFTENHQVLYHSAEYLVGLMFPNTVFPNNGMTGSEHALHGKTFLRRWLTWRLRFGFSEWLTQGYYMDDILGLCNLTKYAPDEDIRSDSLTLIHLLCYDLALHGFKGHLPTTHGRVYTDFIIEPDHEDCSQMLRFLFGEGSHEGLCGAAVMLACLNYECPPVIRKVYESRESMDIRERVSVDAADAAAFGIDPKDFDNIMFFWGMQTYSDRVCIDNSLKVFPQWNWMVNRVKAYKERYDLCDEAGAPCPDAPDFTAMTEANILTRRTKDYILSSVQDFRKGKMGYQQHPWTASLGGRAVFFTTNPASLEYGNRPNRWAGNLCLPRCGQNRNVLFCIYRILPDFVDFLNSHIYFPTGELDETVEKENRIFGRKGSGYIAVTTLNPGYWDEKDPDLFRFVYGDKGNEMFEKAGKYEFTVQGHANVWAIEMGSEEENGSFEQFVASFDGCTLQGDTHDFTYLSPSQGEMRFGWGRPLTVNGTNLPLNGYGRYDSPFGKTQLDALETIVSCGGETLILDTSRR